MNKPILVFVLILVSLNVFAQDDLIKVNTKLQNEIFKIQLLLKSPMVGYKESQGIGFRNGRVKSIDYITKVIVKSNNQIIFNINVNPYLSKNPLIKFKIKEAPISEKAELIVENNIGNTYSKMFIIKNVKKRNIAKKDTFKAKDKNKSFWIAPTVDEAIEILYGSKEMTHDVINISTVGFTSPSYIPISINTDVELETLTILMTGNPQSAVATISIPSGKLLNFSTKLKLIYPIQISKNKYGKYDITHNTFITVIGKGRDEKLYRTTKFVETPSSGVAEIEDYEIEELYKAQH